LTRLLPVGSFFGVPLYFAPSWLVIALIITLDYHGVITAWVDGIGSGAAYVVAFAFAVLLAICVLLHELGHVALSLLLGKPVRRVVIFLLGGVSEIDGELERPRDEFLVAIAGPAMSGILAVVSLVGYNLVPDDTIASALLLLLFLSNLVVAIFNMLPGLPLDGGRVLRSVVWGAAHSASIGTRVAGWSGRAVAVAIVGLGLLWHPGGWSTINALYGFALGAFIWFGASQSLKLATVQERVPQLSVRSLMRPGLMVPADVPVAEALRRLWQVQAGGLVVIDSADRPTALVDEHRIRSLPVDRHPWVPVGTLARPLEPGLVLPADLSGQAVLDAVRRTPATEYLIVEPDGSLAGILAANDLVAQVAPTGISKGRA
jgi:Zn-dependent protease/CBS domain-containing protein